MAAVLNVANLPKDVLFLQSHTSLLPENKDISFSVINLTKVLEDEAYCRICSFDLSNEDILLEKLVISVSPRLCSSSGKSQAFIASDDFPDLCKLSLKVRLWKDNLSSPWIKILERNAMENFRIASGLPVSQKPYLPEKHKGESYCKKPEEDNCCEKKGESISNFESYTLDADTLILSDEISKVEVEILTGEIREVHLAGWSRCFVGVKGWSSSDFSKFETEAVSLNVPFRSQMVETTVSPRDICLPTSLTMILRYYDVLESNDKFISPTAFIARCCFDPVNEIYGNWIKACVTAGAHELNAYVMAIKSLNDLLKLLNQAIPPIVSVSYGKGELTGAPVEKTTGHLLVVRGVDKDGRILVNDPAGMNCCSGAISYDPVEFAAALKGVAIVVSPK